VVAVAERESRRLDGRAVRNGVSRAFVVTVALFGVLVVCRAVFRPVVRDLARGASLPNVWQLLGAAAVVGLAVGWSRMRASRRYVAPGADTLDALDIARRRIAADRERGARTAITGPVQRWDSSLLAGGDPDALEEGVEP